MRKVYKILNKYNKNYLYKQKENRRSVKFYLKDFERQGLDLKIKDDFDYLEFTLLRSSYENMRSIQNAFFEIKESLRDLWTVITYQERHFLLYQELDKTMDELKSFEVEDKRYFITYFDMLMNAYYDHDMLMFENPSYVKYLYDFKDIVDDKADYGIEPLKQGFAQIDYIVGDDENYVMYNRVMKRFYHIHQHHKVSVGMNVVLNDEHIHNIALLIKNYEKEELINYLIEQELGSKKVLKKLVKLQKKLS